MKVLPLPSGVASLQKCYLPMKYFEDLGHHLSKYAIIQLKFGYCVVKLNFSVSLNDSFCHINAAVCSSMHPSSSLLFRGKLQASSIALQGGPFEATSANISIIFENLEKLVAWKKRVHSKQVLIDILELYVVSTGTNVFLNDIKDYLDLGILRITINRIRGRANTQEAVFKLVSNTNIIVESELTERMLKAKTSVHAGGMEKPFRLLSDVVNNRKMFRSSFISRNVLLVGPAGCGKKSLVRRVAKDCDTLIIEINGSEIMCPSDSQGRPGEVEANIIQTFELIRIYCEQLSAYGIGNKISKTMATSIGPKKPTDHSNSSPMVILLLTHVELMCPNRKQVSSCQTTQFLGAMDSLQHLDNLLIFATSNTVDDVDQAIRRPGRLDKEVYIGIPDEAERSEIIKELLLGDEGAVPREETARVARAAAALTPGRVPADLSLLCRQVKWMHLQGKHSDAEGGGDDGCKWLRDFRHCASKLPVSSLLGGPGTLISDSHTSSDSLLLSSIGGLQGVKERLVISVREPLLHPEAFRRLGINPPRGVLLFGPPGCAKTTLARALAFAPTPSSTTTHAITFLSSSAAELYSPFVGESEKAVVELFQRARAGAPSIVFIDELDALFGSRDGMHKGGVQERVLAALLMEMDGVGHRLIAPTASTSHSISDQMMVDCRQWEGSSQSSESTYVPAARSHSTEPYALVTVIAATNRPDLIDDALLRPGRLDQLIYVPPPNEEARYAILSYYTEKMPIEGDDRGLLLRELAKGTDLYSGADLKNLCKEAALKAISEEGFEVMEVKKKYFVAALKSMRSSLTSDMVLSYQQFCNNKFL